MWISKEADVRRQELLDAALDIFNEKGYDKTSINDIIGKVGVTKGAFYYYFNSKEEVLLLLARQQADEIVRIVREIAYEHNLNAREKLDRIIRETHQHRSQNMESRLKLFILLQNDGNSMLTNKIYENLIEDGKPVVYDIIQQGISEGSFHVKYVHETAELFIQLNVILNSSMQKLLISESDCQKKMELIKRKLLFYEEMLNKILGVEENPIRLAATLLDSIPDLI